MAQIYIEITCIKKFVQNKVQIFMLEVLAYKQTRKKTFRDNRDRKKPWATEMAPNLKNYFFKKNWVFAYLNTEFEKKTSFPSYF